MQIITGAIASDTISGTAEAEFILGDPNDTRPGPGNLIFALRGNDQVFAGYGADTVYGGAGDDRLYGNGTTQAPGMSAAYLAREDGADLLVGGAGNDLIVGAGGDDTLRGGTGNDLLYGDWGADRLVGGAGNDTLHGGLGPDRLTGGEGADLFVFAVSSAPAANGLEAGVGANRDVVLDFTSGEDVLRFDGIAADAVAWEQRANGVLVHIAAPDGAQGEIMLRGVTDLSAADMVFA